MDMHSPHHLPTRLVLLSVCSAVGALGSVPSAIAATVALAPSMDIWTTSVYSYAPGGPGPGGGLNNHQLRVGGWGDEYRSLIQFNLDSAPTTAASATLRLYSTEVNGGSPVPMYVDRVTSSWDWTEKPITALSPDNERLWWVNRPAFTNIGTTVAPSVGSYLDIDVTSLYNQWQSGTENFGIQLRPTETSNDWSYFGSSESAIPKWRPQLIVDTNGVTPLPQAVNSAWSGLLDGYTLLGGTSIGGLEIWSQVGGTGSFETIPLLLPPGGPSGFQANGNTYVIVHGWCSGCSEVDQAVPGWVNDYAEAIRADDSNANILAYNWQREAAASVNVPNQKVQPASQDLARELEALALSSGGLGNVQLIGHSLGAAIVARVAGDPELEFAPINTEISRLTLFDAPEDYKASGLSGRVILTDFVAEAKNKVGIIENYYGNSVMAFGVPYSGIANTRLSGAVHSFDSDYDPYSPQGWYLLTVDPSIVSPGIIDREMVGTAGFRESSASLLARYDKIYSNSYRAPESGVFQLSPPPPPEQIYQSTPMLVADVQLGSLYADPNSLGAAFNCSKWGATGTATCMQDQGVSLTTNSPSGAFTHFFVSSLFDAVSFDFRPLLWGAGDAFIIGINDQLIYSLTSDFFADKLMSTGLLDLSPWSGQDVTLTFGLLSDSPGHSLSVERIALYNTMSQSAKVSEPSTFALLSLSLIGLAAVRRRYHFGHAGRRLGHQ